MYQTNTRVVDEFNFEAFGNQGLEKEGRVVDLRFYGDLLSSLDIDYPTNIGETVGTATFFPGSVRFWEGLLAGALSIGRNIFLDFENTALFIDDNEEGLMIQALKRYKQNHEKKLDLISEIYEIKDETAVLCYLEEYPDLIGTLLAAEDYINLYFGQDAPVTLEIIRDYEVNELGELHAIVLIDSEVEEALESYEEFEDQWYLEQLHRSEAKLFFDIEFV